MTATKLIQALKKHSSPERKESNEWFFKTGPGQYGEGDRFIGVRVPHIRQVARQFLDLDFTEIAKLIKSPIHEVRLAAILILVERNKQAIKNKDNKTRRQILKFYLKHRRCINNWDLVDLSAGYILGQAIWDNLQTTNILYRYANSKSMWERRIAIVSTGRLIWYGDITDCLQLSKLLLKDKEDLMHKAVGWMLRESWKKQPQKVEKFLQTNYKYLPRTALRYAIERMPEAKRKRFLKGSF